MDPDTLVPIGQIIGAFGVKGWVKIRDDTKNSLIRYSGVYVGVGSQPVFYEIEDSLVNKGNCCIKLNGVVTRDQAILLRGQPILVKRSAFPKIGSDEYYWVDLIGLEVVNQAGNYFGIVTEIMDTGANGVLVVTDTNLVKKELIPFVGKYIVEIKDKRITVDWELSY